MKKFIRAKHCANWFSKKVCVAWIPKYVGHTMQQVATKFTPCILEYSKQPCVQQSWLMIRHLAVKSSKWGYKEQNLFQEVLSGLKLTTRECDAIASTLVAKDYRGMFKRMKENLDFAATQGMVKEDLKTVILLLEKS